MAKKYLEGRIRYDANYKDKGEYFVFELKWSNESEWGLEKAFPLVKKDEDDDEYNFIHFTALTAIRQWQNLGIKFYFA